MEVVGLLMVACALAGAWIVRRVMRAHAVAVPEPITDRAALDEHRVDGDHVYSRSTLRVRAQSTQGVRLARGSIAPPIAVSGVIVIPEPEPEPVSQRRPTTLPGDGHRPVTVH